MVRVCDFFAAVIMTAMMVTGAWGGELVAHWKLGESDGTRVVDLSGNGVDGEVIGEVSFTEGDYGRAMVFDGGAYVDFGKAESVAIGDGLTIEVWMKPRVFPRGQYRMIVGKHDKKNNGWMLYHAGWDNNIWLYGERPDEPLLRNYLRTGYVMGGWHYLAVTYDGKHVRFYVDGKERHSRANSGAFSFADAPLRIGRMSDDQEAGDFFEGEIAEIKLYNYAINKTKIWRRSCAPIHSQVKVMDVPASMQLDNSGFDDDRSKEEWIASHRAVGWPIAPKITAEEAEAVCRDIRAKGFDTVFLSGRYRYMFAEEWGERNWWNSVPWEDYLKATRLFSEACTANGLKLVMHLTANLALYPDYERLFKGMETVFVDTGEPGEWPRYYGYSLCPNNPDFKRLYLGRLREMMQVVEPDGMMIDETGFGPVEVPGGKTCGCEHCRALFREQYGFEIPSDTKDKAVWKNWENEQWRAWQKFRVESVGRWAGERKAAINEVLGETLYTSCSSAPLQAFTPQLVGGDAETFMKHGTVFFYESQPATPWSWRKVVAEGKYVNALGPVILFVNTASVSQTYWSFILGMAHGWCNHQWPEYTEWQVVPVVWQEKWQNLWLGNESLANVALVYSGPTRTLSGKYVEPENDMTEYIGWAQALTEMHVPFDVVTAMQLEEGEALAGYDLVILADTFCLSQGQGDVLREFVKAGGTMIATDESTVYDYEGRRGEDFALADVFGVHLAKVQEGERLGELAGVMGGVYDIDAERYCVVEREGAEILLSREGDTGAAVLAVNPYGKGECVYGAFQLGTGCYMPQVGVGWYGEAGYWSDNRDKDCKAVIERLIDAYAVLPMRTENVPEEVIVNAVRHATRGYKGTMIHLVNGLGTHFEDYALVPPEQDFEFVDYPPVAEWLGEGKSMRFTVEAAGVRGAYLVSPDFRGVVRLPFAINDDGTATVTVANLYRYGVVYLVQSETDLVADTADVILDAIPEASGFDIAYTCER